MTGAAATSEMAGAATTLVVGLGNRIMRDDALGLEVARRLESLVDADVLCLESSVLALLDHLWAGYERLILVDATVSGVDEPGTIRRSALPSEPLRDTGVGRHGTSLADVVELGRRSGQPVPRDISVYTMEVGDISDFGEGLTEPVRAAIPRMVDRVVREQFGTLS